MTAAIQVFHRQSTQTTLRIGEIGTTLDLLLRQSSQTVSARRRNKLS